MKRLTKNLIEERLKSYIKSDEELLECGWATKGATGFYFIGLTNKRVILERVSISYKTKNTEFIELSNIEAYQPKAGRGDVPEWIKWTDLKIRLQDMGTSTLVLKPSQGKTLYFHFPTVIGFGDNNSAIPFRIAQRIHMMHPEIPTRVVKEKKALKRGKVFLISFLITFVLSLIGVPLLAKAAGNEEWGAGFIGGLVGGSIMGGVVIGGIIALFAPLFKLIWKGES